MLNLLKKIFYSKSKAPQTAKLLADIRQVKIIRTIPTNGIEARADQPNLQSIGIVLNSCKFLRLLFTLSLVFKLCCSIVFAQDTTTVFNRMMANSGTLYYSHPIEKVYIHFDKPYYAVGDTIWFKAYLTADNHLPSTLSKIIYVDVIGPRDSLMQSLKLPVTNSVAWSFIPISQYNYKKGNYRIVAYTNWMNNADLGYFFNKTITIGDAINNNLSTNIFLQRTTIDQTVKVSANICYKNDMGMPYGGKKVIWLAKKNDETIARGKVVTDKNGFANISFVNLKNVRLDSANIVTNIDIGTYENLTSTFSLKAISAPNDMQFFPEGGSLLAGVQTKVAFKAIKPNGLGIDIKGVILDNNNTEVVKFKSSHLGMGAFDFTPEAGKTYTAKITCADGTLISPALPKVQTSGINLSLDNSDPDILGVKLKTDKLFLQKYKGQMFFILAKSEGLICFAATTQLTDMVYSASIPKNKFPTGILQVTLFAADGSPVTERIAFIQHNNPLKLTISADKPLYTTRQKVKLTIGARKNDGPDEGNFSITVVDDAKVPYDENAETTILTNLLLTSDIKGYIEKPNYYFIHPNEKTVADLDVLLLTQGYHRYAYNGVLQGKYPPINFPAEQDIAITGTVSTSTGTPVAKGNVTLSMAGKGITMNTPTDTNGRFKFTNLEFPDSTKVKLSARSKLNDSTVVITIDSNQAQRIPVNYTKADEIVNIDTVLHAYLINSKAQFKNTHILNEVVIKDTKIVKAHSHLDDGRLATLQAQPDGFIKGERLWGWNSFLNRLKQLAYGMAFDEGKQIFHVTHRLWSSDLPALIFVDGTETNVSHLQALNANDIESVEVFLHDDLKVVNQRGVNWGVIVINMRKAEGKKVSLDELKSLLRKGNNITYIPKGYNAAKTFYSPRYDLPGEQLSPVADIRSTIYWNSNINTDKTTGTTSVEYFNADGTGTYRVIIEGIDKDGNLGRQVFRYEVK